MFAVNKIIQSMGLLEGKVALITGGSRGIGQGIVEAYAKAGAHVVFTYLSSESKAQDVASTASQYGTQVIAMRSDASYFDQSEALINSVVDQFGQLDILINNAGITKDGLILRMTEEQWDDVINVNLKSVFNLTKHALVPMMRKRTGSIIHMSSVVGVFGNAGQANYAASKAGIIGFSKSIAKEVGSRNIRSNVIAPGFIETEMTDKLTPEQIKSYADSIPLKKLGKVGAIADACLFLGSDMSQYVTGQTLSVCGGLNI